MLVHTIMTSGLDREVFTLYTQGMVTLLIAISGALRHYVSVVNLAHAQST